MLHDVAPGAVLEVATSAGGAPDGDQLLVRRARAGDLAAFEVLLRRHRDRIFRVALRIVGNSHDAEDVLQDVALSLWCSLGSFHEASSFSTWLHRIVVNRSLNHQRSRSRTVTSSYDEHEEGAAVAGPEDIVVGRVRMQRALAAIAELPPALRSVLVLHEFENQTYREIATILEVTEQTVRGRLARARRRLLAALADSA